MYGEHLRKPMGSITITWNTIGRVRVSRSMLFLFSIFTIVQLVFYYALLTLPIQLLLLCWTVLCSCWTNHYPQDPIIRVSAVQRAEGWIVRALWSTPSDAALLASYLGAQCTAVTVHGIWTLGELSHWNVQLIASQIYLTDCTKTVLAVYSTHVWLGTVPIWSLLA